MWAWAQHGYHNSDLSESDDVEETEPDDATRLQTDVSAPSSGQFYKKIERWSLRFVFY
jgi:hypothetical protein